MALKITIRPHQCFDNPNPKFDPTSSATIGHVRVTIFLSDNPNIERLTSLFCSITGKIQKSSFHQIFTQSNSQVVEPSKKCPTRRFCMDFHLTENKHETLLAVMESIAQHLNRQEGLPRVQIKSRSSHCCLAYSLI